MPNEIVPVAQAVTVATVVDGQYLPGGHRVQETWLPTE